jgi:hypothetical protein
MRRDTCPDLFDEREHFDELVGFDQIQLRLAELKHQGAVVYSMDVKRGAYVLRGSLPVRHREQPVNTPTR